MGNPKQIHDWQDLVRDDVKLVFPNPKTSGNGRYTYLAAWGIQQQTSGNDKSQIQDWMKRLLHNVAVFDVGGRGATTTFVERNIGDALISFESEVNSIRDKYAAEGFEVIVPQNNILAEFPVAWLDKNVARNQTEKEAKAYLEFLYTEPAQQVMIRHHYRVANQQLMAQSDKAFPEVKLFRVEDKLGAWAQVMQTHFSQGGILDQLLAEGAR